MEKKLNVNVQERENISTGNVYENVNEIFKLRCATSDGYVLRCTQHRTRGAHLEETIASKRWKKEPYGRPHLPRGVAERWYGARVQNIYRRTSTDEHLVGPNPRCVSFQHTFHTRADRSPASPATAQTHNEDVREEGSQDV